MLLDAAGIAKLLSVQKSTVYQIAKRKRIKPAARHAQTVCFPGAKFPLTKFINMYESDDFLNKTSNE